MLVAEEEQRSQLERVLHSENFRGSESLRRLLKYLGEKSLLGEADSLKEYTIGLDAFGKPSSYDPRHDSIVRLQTGRLRQRLAEYYRTEGKNDPLLIDLPKGGFKVTFDSAAAKARSLDVPLEQTNATAGIATSEPVNIPVLIPSRLWRIAVGLAGALALMGLLAVYLFSELRDQRRENASYRASWTPELEALWKPFVASSRPLVVAVGAPLFVRMGRTVFRDVDANSWAEAIRSPAINSVDKVLHNPRIEPDSMYVPLGEVSTTFLLGKLLATREMNISIAKSTQLSWQQLADNNVIFVGAPQSFGGMLSDMPIQEEFILDRAGVRDLHPPPGAPDYYPQQGERTPDGLINGSTYAVVAHTPGPLGKGDVAIFAGNTTPARVGAIEWFTDPTLARMLVQRLKGASDHLPHYYQVVFKVVYKDSVPVETTYVAHRELQLRRSSPSPAPGSQKN
jgi:hypothetical protein